MSNKKGNNDDDLNKRISMMEEMIIGALIRISSIEKIILDGNITSAKEYAQVLNKSAETIQKALIEAKNKYEEDNQASIGGEDKKMLS